MVRDGVFALITAAALVTATRHWLHPFTARAQIPPLLAAAFWLVAAAPVVGVSAVVVRFARSSGEERLQLKWFAATLAGDPRRPRKSSAKCNPTPPGAGEPARPGPRDLPAAAGRLGLAAALNAQARKSPLPVAVEAAGVGRFGQDIEAAVYFCCLEALQNTAKYGHATQAQICLQARNEALWFTVSDGGTGYDTRHTQMGSGLRNMADRLAAFGGRLQVRSAPSQGTTITGHLPIRATSSSH